MDNPQIMPRHFWRPRLSLLSALLLMTIVGMAIVVAQFWQEVGPLRKEVRALRNEVGRLSIDDRSKIHAMSVPTGDDLTWKWRLWIPEGKTVTARLKWGQVPRTGVPQRPNNSLTFGSGEVTLTLNAHRSASGEKWFANLQTSSGGGATIEIPVDQAFFLWDLWGGAGDGVGESTAFEPDQKIIVLKRNRVIRGRVGEKFESSTINKMDEPTAGFIIWLDQH